MVPVTRELFVDLEKHLGGEILGILYISRSKIEIAVDRGQLLEGKLLETGQALLRRPEHCRFIPFRGVLICFN